MTDLEKANYEELQAKLRKLKSMIEDVQREMMDVHSCCGVQELCEAYSRIHRVEDLLRVEVRSR